jgi:plastocyanin
MPGKVWVAALVCVVAGAIAMPTAAAARTKVVYAGGPAKFQGGIGTRYGAGVDNFLIKRVTINAGDTVDWNGTALSGGFHTVDIPAKGGSDLPLIIPTGKIVTGVNDFAGNPFWFNGKVPAVGFDPALFGPSGGHKYNGSKRIDSGLPLGPPSDFKVTFTKAGVYKYFCDVHYGMVGYVIVRAKGKAVPSAADDKATLAKEENADVAIAKKVDTTTVKKNTVSLGASGPSGVEVFAMFPAKLTVTAGTVVTFFMSKDTRETHTATFGPKSYLMPLAGSFAGPAPSPIAVYPSAPPGTVTLSPTSHGNGFASTGAMDRDARTPLPPSGQIKFTKPGTYHYICLIHAFMHGTVVVK